jgi:prepilin-type processing-associated H-X9-DG protein
MTRGTPCRRLQHPVDRMTPMSVMKRPAEMVLFFDGILYNQMIINANRVNARHGRKTQTNIGFFDGHAETFLTQDLPGGMSATPADFSLINLQAKYPRPLWLLEQQY